MILAKARSIEERYQRLLARRTDGTPEAMAAEDARLRDLVERCSGPVAVEAIRSADAEARAKVREEFGIEFASEGGYAAEVIDFHGLQVVVENPVGSVRAGVDPDGKAWATELAASYGYISGTEGADGDMVDVFIGPDASSTTAYVARCQVAGKWGTYDEDKVMLGFPSEEAAREAFLQNYNDPRFLGGLDAMSIEKLKERLCKPGRLAKSLLIFTKAHVGPYLRNGKLVNLSGYQGRNARARVAAGQMGLFSDLPPAVKPARKKADDMARFDHETTGDLFADADEHGEVPPARVLMPRRDTVTESRQELIAEHERLVDVLRSPSHEDDKAEAKKQAAELAEYKAGDGDKPILLLTSERKSANAQNVLTSASSDPKVEVSELSDTARRESGAQEKKMSGYTLEDLSKPDLYESDEKVKAAAKIVMNEKFPGDIGRGEWKAKVRAGGAAAEVLAVLEEKAQAEQKAAKKASKAKADAGELVAPSGYTINRENGEILLRGPWSDDLHARIKRAGGTWEGSGWGTGRAGRKAWVIPEDKASSLKRIFANVGDALAAEDADRKAAAQAAAEKAEAEKAEADRKQAEARASAPTITPGQHGPFTVRVVSGGYRVMFPYDSARVAQIKANGGKKFDPVDKSWFVDAADAGKLQSILDRAKAAAAAAPAAPASSAAPVSARKPRVLFPLSTMPRMGVPVTWRGRTVVFESKGEPFRINEDHPSMHGSHLLGHEGDRGAYAYYRDATPEEVQGMQAAKDAPAEKSWAYSSDAVQRALEGRD